MGARRDDVRATPCSRAAAASRTASGADTWPVLKTTSCSAIRSRIRRSGPGSGPDPVTPKAAST